MLHESIKVSLITVSVDQLIYLLIKRGHVMSVGNSADNPSETGSGAQVMHVLGGSR